MATSIQLTPEVERRLGFLASQTRRTKAFSLRESIERGIQDTEDSSLSAGAQAGQAVSVSSGRWFQVVLTGLNFRHLIPDLVVQLASMSVFLNTAPLLEKERGARAPTLFLNGPNPCGFHRSRAKP